MYLSVVVVFVFFVCVFFVVFFFKISVLWLMDLLLTD